MLSIDNNINISINNDNYEENKLIWKCIYNYDNNYNYYNDNDNRLLNLYNIFDIIEIKNKIIQIIGDEIISEFNDINYNSIININILRIKKYSEELILETLVQHNNDYSMCCASLPLDLLDNDNDKFEEWYLNNIYHINQFNNNYTK